MSGKVFIGVKQKKYTYFGVTFFNHKFVIYNFLIVIDFYIALHLLRPFHTTPCTYHDSISFLVLFQ